MSTRLYALLVEYGELYLLSAKPRIPQSLIGQRQYDQSSVTSPPCSGSVGPLRQTAVLSFHAGSSPSNHAKARTTRKYFTRARWRIAVGCWTRDQ